MNATRKPKARIVYIHPELPAGRPFTTGWMGRSRIMSMWTWLVKFGVTTAHTELR